MNKKSALLIWLIMTVPISGITYLSISYLPKTMNNNYFSILMMGLVYIGVWFIIEFESAVGLDLWSNEAPTTKGE